MWNLETRTPIQRTDGWLPEEGEQGGGGYGRRGPTPGLTAQHRLPSPCCRPARTHHGHVTTEFLASHA